MNKFRLGLITGMSSLVIAVPLIAQVSSAQSTSDVATAEPPVPTQACVQAMATLESAHLNNFDAMNAQHKQAMQTRVSALTAAAQIEDDAARQDALKQMREDMKSAMDADKDQVPADIQSAMDAVKTACGDTFMPRMGGERGDHMFVGKMEGKFPGFLADKLGMTEDELKAALDSGKTIQDIATEKGVDLPMPPKRGHGPMQFFNQKIDQ